MEDLVKESLSGESDRNASSCNVKRCEAAFARALPRPRYGACEHARVTTLMSYGMLRLEGASSGTIGGAGPTGWEAKGRTAAPNPTLRACNFEAT